MYFITVSDEWINDDTDNASDHIYSMQIPVSRSPDHNYSSHMIKQNSHVTTSLEINALPDPINMSQIAAEVASVDAMNSLGSLIGDGASANEDNNLHKSAAQPSPLICEDDKQLMSIIHTVIDNRSTEMAAVSISGNNTISGSHSNHQMEDENGDFSRVTILDLHSTPLDSSSHVQAPPAKVVCLATMQDGGGDLKVELNTKPIEIKPVSAAKEMTSQKQSQSLLSNKDKNIQSVTYWLPSGITNAVVSNAEEDKGQGDSNINSNISGQPATELRIRFEKESLIQTNDDEAGGSATNRVVDRVLKASKKGKAGRKQQKSRQKQPKPKQERRRRGKAVGVDKATAESEEKSSKNEGKPTGSKGKSSENEGKASQNEGSSSKNEGKSSEREEKSSENEGISSENKGNLSKNEGQSNRNDGISSKKEEKPIPLAKANLQKPTTKKPAEAQNRSKPEQLSSPLQKCEDPVVIEPLAMNAIINFKTSQFVNDNTCQPTGASQLIGLKAMSTNEEQIKHLNINSTEISSSLTPPNSSHSTEQDKTSQSLHLKSSVPLTSKSDQKHHNTITNTTHGKLENKSLSEKKMDSSSDKSSNSDKITNSTYQNVLDRINSLISTNKNRVHGPSPAKAKEKEKPTQNIDDVRKRIEALLQQNETHISQTSINSALLPTQNPPKVTLADKIRLAKESLDPASSSNMADASLPVQDPEVKKQEAVKRIEELIAQNDDYIEHGTAAYREQVEKETEMDNLQTLADVCDFKLGAKGHGRKRSWSFTQGHQPQMSKSIGDLKALSDVQGTLVIRKAEMDSAHDHAYIMPRNNIPVEITPKTHVSNNLSAAVSRAKRDKRRRAKNTLKRHELKKAKLACKDDHSYMNIFPPPVKIAPRPGPISPTPPPTEVVPERPKSPPYVTRKKKVAPLTADQVPHPSSFTNEKKKSRPPKVELPHGRAFDVINIQMQFEPIGEETDEPIMTSSASSSGIVTSSVIRDHTYEEDKVNTQQFSILRDHSYKKLKTGEDGGKKKVKRGGSGNSNKKKKGGTVVMSDHTYTPKP